MPNFRAFWDKACTPILIALIVLFLCIWVGSLLLGANRDVLRESLDYAFYFLGVWGLITAVHHATDPFRS